MQDNPTNDLAVYGLMVVLIFFSAFSATAKWALVGALFFLFMVWINAWEKGQLQKTISAFTGGAVS